MLYSTWSMAPTEEVRWGAQGDSHVVPGKSDLHARGEGEGGGMPLPKREEIGTLSPMSLKAERGWKRETLRVTLAGLVQ